MGASSAGEVLDPLSFARSEGIHVHECLSLPWEVASDGVTVLVLRHHDRRVQTARVWEGIAQCLLMRSAGGWSVDEVLQLAARLKLGMRIVH